MEIARVATLSDIGHTMADNEDAVLELPGVPLVAVIDGSAGTSPARLTIEAVRARTAELKRRAKEIIVSGDSASRLKLTRTFEALFNAANERVREQRDKEHNGRLAATLMAATVIGRFAFIAHVGNGRAYLFRGDEVRRLTVDHTLAMIQYRRGEISADELKTSPFGKTLTQALGAAPFVQPDIAEVRLAPGDTLMLCTDGLHRYVSDTQIAAIVARAPTIDRAAAALVAKANELSGRDNVTVALLSIAGGAAPEPHIDVNRALGEVFLFEQLSVSERLLIAPYFELVRYGPGKALCKEGEDGDTFFVIVSGKVDVTHGSAKLIELGPGSYAGEIALARRGKRTATITARTATEVLVLSRERFLEVLKRRPELSARLMLPLLQNAGARIVDLRTRLQTVGNVLAGGDDSSSSTI